MESEIGLKQNHFTNIEAKATGLFVPLVEEEIFSGSIIDETFKHYFKGLKQNPDAVILGCTHFPLLKNELQKYFGKSTQLIHSGEAIVEYLKNRFDLNEEHINQNLQFFASENPEALKRIAHNWLNLK